MYIHTHTHTSTVHAYKLYMYTMNALAVQNPRHKGDFGNKNDSVTDKEITADNI